MRGVKFLFVALASGLASDPALAEAVLAVAGHEVRIEKTWAGAELVVDDFVVYQDEVIQLDPEPLTVGGVAVVTGVAGAGGNACTPAPFVLALPEDGAPKLSGPVESCAYLPVAEVQPDAIVFAAEPVPSTPGEVWVWSPASGFAEGQPEPFAATQGSGWEALVDLHGAHPVEAMSIAPIKEALQAGLGADYPIFAERISELGSGDLTAEGYLGQACLKFTCEADFAVLYLHRQTQTVYAIWHVMGEIENRVWPEDTNLWPPEAMVALRQVAGP
jgi:hypothetical protein